MTEPGEAYSPDALPGDDPDSVDWTDFEQLEESDTLEDTDPHRAPQDPLDEGYEANETPRGVHAWGVTQSEEEAGLPLERELAAEIPDVWNERDPALPDPDEDPYGDPGDDPETALDDGEVGGPRTGRLVNEGGDDGEAEDVGIDGAGASAEEAAVHTIEE